MNKKIVLLLLAFCNSAMPAPWSWESIKEQVSRNADRLSAGFVTLAAISAGMYAYVARCKNAQSQPASREQTDEQKFLTMLAKAIENDIFRLDCALRNEQPCDIKYDALHVWHKGTQNADQKFDQLYNHARTIMYFERFLRTQHEVIKARVALVAMAEAVNHAKNQR